MSGAPVPFVEYVGFLDAALEFGLQLEDGVKELIDNSVDAGSEKHPDYLGQALQCARPDDWDCS